MITKIEVDLSKIETGTLMDELRDRGCAIVVFTVDEIPPTVKINRLEEVMIERGSDYIESWS